MSFEDEWTSAEARDLWLQGVCFPDQVAVFHSGREDDKALQLLDAMRQVRFREGTCCWSSVETRRKGKWVCLNTVLFFRLLVAFPNPSKGSTRQKAVDIFFAEPNKVQRSAAFFGAPSPCVQSSVEFDDRLVT